MKFHHGQKLTVVNGYYATFKGYVKDVRTTKENKTEYLIKLVPKGKEVEELEKWIPEEYMKTSLF